ncbi:glucose 1-dehydrogenase [Microbacterium sp. X-17]|uniref:SDR family NAD(P)-dependent oxidoreductase n=1 Tax=Microbacterium sp. X-17 TaxID=3144404 RepID=UPI0031F51098
MKTAIVTGAGSGIGRATAELFAERGYGVVAVDLNGDSLAWTDDHDTVVPLQGDVRTVETNAAMVALARERFGRLDAVALNAGTAGSPGIEEDDALERLDEILAINVRSVVLGIRHAAPALRESGGGAIVATASTAGIRADPGSWAYNTSKAAVINLVRAAALDYALQNIRVNAVAPGATDTGLATSQANGMEELLKDIASRVPMQRFAVPREQAEAIYFLASPAASYITGTTLVVDGGITAHTGHLALPRATAS